MKGKVVMNSRGARALLNAPGVAADLKRRGDRVAAAAGAGVGVRVTVGGKRARAVVMTETAAARRREAKSKALTRALDAGRG